MTCNQRLLLVLALVLSACSLGNSKLYRISNRDGFTVVITDIGAALQSVLVPSCAAGRRPIDVLLGYQNESDYPKEPHYSFGATVGRVANRVSGAKFELDGKVYKLEANNGPNTLHGGAVLWSKQVWAGSAAPNGREVVFTRTSPDGESGFPGTVAARVVYTIPETGAGLNISISASVSVAATPLNVINHAYWNLKGAGNGNILDHTVQFSAQYYTPNNDSTSLPTSLIYATKGGPFDFTTPTPISKNYRSAHTVPSSGYDDNWVQVQSSWNASEFPEGAQPVWWLPGKNPQVVRPGEPGPRPLVLSATVTAPGPNGLQMQLYADAPGLQLYTADGFNYNKTMAGPGKGGVYYEPYGGFALEPQAFPNAINIPRFPSSVVRPGQKWANNIAYKFSCPTASGRRMA